MPIGTKTARPNDGNLEYDKVKRHFDITASLLGLVVVSPVLLVLAALVRFACGKPVLFRQQRVGYGGRHFTMLKLRTMRCAPLSFNPSSSSYNTGSFEAGDISRVTRIGKFLRKWKLDEIPQLWNVLEGDMSLVGPRPEITKWVNVYRERWANVLAVYPGITDPASIEFRNEESLLAAATDPEKAYRDEILPRKLDLYEEYVRNRSFWGDIGILCRTVRALFRNYSTSLS